MAITYATPNSQASDVEFLDATVTRLGVVLRPNGSPEEVEGVLNPASVRARDGSLLLYPRLVGKGNVSRIGIVRSTECGSGMDFVRSGYALEPTTSYELRPENSGGMGCEDPRVTFIPVLDRYAMAYTAYGPAGPRIVVALSNDALHWDRLGLVDFSTLALVPGDDKDGVFFPEPVYSPQGVLSLAMYHRPMLHLSTQNGYEAIRTILNLAPEKRESTRIAYIPLVPVLADIHNLLKVAESSLVLAPNGPWGKIKTGGGTPPVRIAEGWLSLYHGVDAVEIDGHYKMTYSAGMVVHDIDQPHIVRYRSLEPVMHPEGRDETVGIVNNVVFPTAIDPRGERIFDVYYGMADAKIGRARLSLASDFSARS